MKKRIMILSLCLAGALTVPALALTTSTADVENAAPIAEDLVLKTYKGVAISSRFAAVDPEGDLVTFQVVDSPARGQVALDENDPAAFTYTPYEGKKGKDSFTYVAIDAKGNTSKPATVKIVIQKQAAVSYSDLSDDPAHYAALRLAEAGVYTGRRVGDLYCFDPEETFTREEFLAMAMTAAGREPLSDVTLTGFYDDTDISAWAKGYVSAALVSGAVEGSPNEAGQTVFAPDSPVTQAEAAVIIDRLLAIGDVAGTASAFSAETAPAWAYQSAVNMEAVSVLSSSTDLSKPLTRAESAQMLSAMLDVLEARDAGGWPW